MKKEWKNPPEMQIDPKKSYTVNMETNKGTIMIALYPKYPPFPLRACVVAWK